MSRRLAASSLLCLAIAAAQPGPATAKILVEITRPEPGTAIFGQVEIAAVVLSPNAVDRVELWIDGDRVDVRRQQPYRFLVDVGSENREHHIAVVAYDRRGDSRRAEMVTPRVHIDERVDLGLEQLYVTVTDHAGRRVLDLAPGELTLDDDGVPQEIVTFAAGNIPFTAVLLVDGSESMQGERLQAALAGARSFAAGMGEFDEAKILVYSDRLLEITPWHGAGQPATTALETLEASGGTAILDHLFMALAMLESRNGRPVVVLLSDGWDFESVVAAEGLRRLVRRSQAVLYWVRLAGDEPGRSGRILGSPGTVPKNEPLRVIGANSWRDAAAARDVYRQLEQMVRESGGRAETIADVAEIGPAFVDILSEIRQQVALGYYPQPKRQDGAWRKIRVEVPGRRLTVRTRLGYVDQPPQP